MGVKQTSDRSYPRVIVLKVYCPSREHTRQFKEEEMLQEIHKEGYIPGVLRICQNLVERPLVLPRYTQYPEEEFGTCMISLATTGKNLSMCKDILQFFKTMYDLTEGSYLSSIIHIDTNIL